MKHVSTIILGTLCLLSISSVDEKLELKSQKDDDPRSNPYNNFGVVKKELQLPEERILPEVRPSLRNGLTI